MISNCQFRIALLFWTACGLLHFSAPALCGEPARSGRIHIYACDTFGAPLGAVVDAVDADGKPVSLDGALPYGTYTLYARHMFFEPWKKDIDLYEPHLTVVVGLPMRDLGDRTTVGYELHGTIANYQGSDPIVARVVSVVGATVKDATVTDHRTFVFERLPSGRYFIVLLSGREIFSGGEFAVGAMEGSAEIHLDLTGFRKELR